MTKQSDDMTGAGGDVPRVRRPALDDLALTSLAAAKSQARDASLHALHLLEYALSAPAPRRQRTWQHRVSIALDVLADALDRQLHAEDDSFGLLAEIALSEPEYALPVQRLRQELLDLTVAVASLREQIEPDPEMVCDPVDIRTRLAVIAPRFRAHLAQEADLVYDATHIDLQQADR
jgi:hypothetical protein